MKFLGNFSLQGGYVYPNRYFNNNFEVALTAINYRLDDKNKISVASLNFKSPISGQPINVLCHYVYSFTQKQYLSHFTKSDVLHWVHIFEYVRQYNKVKNLEIEDDDERSLKIDAFLKDKYKFEDFKKPFVDGEDLSFEDDDKVVNLIKEFCNKEDIESQIPWLELKNEKYILHVPKNCPFKFQYNHSIIAQASKTFDAKYLITDTTNDLSTIKELMLAINIKYNDLPDIYPLRYIAKKVNEEIRAWTSVYYISSNVKFLNKVSIIISDPAGEYLKSSGDCILHFRS
jgi:hypothetical protein